MRRGVVLAVAGLALVVAAGVVHAAAPPEELRQAPFEVSVPLGQAGGGRNIEVTFTDVRLADRVEAQDAFEPWVGETTGTWVVVDLTAQAVVAPAGVRTWLLVDGLIISGSTRPGAVSLEGALIAPGLPVAGAVLFEIPDSVVDATSARVLVGTNGDWRLDSAIALTVNPAELDHERVVPILPYERVA